MPLFPEPEARAALDHLLTGLGVEPGRVVNLAIDMGRVPLPDWRVPLDSQAIAERGRRWCGFILEQVMDHLGPAGTLVVHTFSYSYARGIPFDRQATPSEVGPFTEYVRQQEGTRRSLHPMFSLSAMGALADELTRNVGKSAFGPTSSFAALVGHGARFVALGTTVGQSMTYLHHMEQQVGANHRYNKAFATPVMDDGRTVPGPWLANLRWRGLDCLPGLTHAEAGLRAGGVLTEIEWMGYPNQAVDIIDTDRVGYAMLAADPHAFAEYPVVVELDENAVAEAPVRTGHATFRLEHG